MPWGLVAQLCSSLNLREVKPSLGLVLFSEKFNLEMTIINFKLMIKERESLYIKVIIYFLLTVNNHVCISKNIIYSP